MFLLSETANITPKSFKISHKKEDYIHPLWKIFWNFKTFLDDKAFFGLKLKKAQNKKKIYLKK